MKFAVLILALFPLLLSAQEPTIDERPHPILTIWLPPMDLPASGQLSVTVYLCRPDQESPACDAKRALWQHLKDERDLEDLIIEDFRNAKIGNMNRDLRDRMAAIESRLAKNKYD